MLTRWGFWAVWQELPVKKSRSNKRTEMYGKSRALTARLFRCDGMNRSCSGQSPDAEAEDEEEKLKPEEERRR